MSRWLAVLLLTVATIVAFAPIVHTGFVDWDDDVYVSANAHVQQGVGATSLRWALTSFHAANWHPVTWVSHMIDWELYGPRPFGHHLTNLLVHLASVLVLFFALDGMTGAPGRSAFAAALFSVHPLHVESVVWLAERKDVLCALFWFLSIAVYARWTQAPRLSLRVKTVLFAALALMSKPMAVTLPLTLLVLDFWPLGITRSRTAMVALRDKAPLFVLCGGAAWLTVMAQHASQAISSVEACPIGQRMGNAVVATVTYLGKMFWPVQLAVFYPHPGGTLPAWKIIGAAAVLVLISVVAVRLRRTKPYLLFGWLWYLVTLLPVIGLVQVGEQAMADRYTYVPLVGIFVALSWGANDLIGSPAARGDRRDRSRIAAATGIAVVLVLIAVTRFQVRFWKDGETLFTRALAVTENNDVAHAHLGMLRGRQGRLEEAEAHLREALRIHPSSALARVDLGMLLIQHKKPDEALVEFRVALRLDPGFTAARIGLGTVFSDSGRLDEAVVQFQEAISADPMNAEAHDRAGTALARLSRYDEAYAHFAEAIRLSPAFARAHFSLAAALFFLEDYAGAWREVRLAQSHGFEPPPGFVSMLSAKGPEPR